jgi:replication factor C small subunit
MEQLFIEKYRPSTISEVIFQNDDLLNKFSSFVTNKEIPNLLLSGVQGTGKTTISRALIRDLNVDSADIMTINASDENSVDVIREKIKNFAYTIPMGRFKVIQLEEFDYLSHNAQASLRALIEDTSETTRFIATCNYDNKILPSIKSRFQQFHFKAPDVDQVLIRMAEILTQENVEFDLDLLEKFVRSAYPDIRAAINLIQQYSHDGKLKPIASASSSADWKFALLDILPNGNFREMRKLVCENASKEEYEDIFRFMYENINKCKSFASDDKQEAAIVVIADHLYRHSIVADPEINIAALFISLGGI